MLDLNYDITGLRGAGYNPRKIADEDIAVLAESIRRFGIVKPLIVRGTLLVAGHQRTKALRSLGIDRAPVFVLSKDTTTYDEVRFNQLHNGTDMDCGDENLTIEGGFTELGYCQVDAARVRGNFRGRMVMVRKAICDLILAYGPWGAVVATQSGKVIHCAQYALASATMRAPLTCFVIPDDRESEYAAFLGRQYGKFSYENLPRDTFIQTFAQMMRLRAGPSGKLNKSTLYETQVLPWLQDNRQARILDFGAGQGDYVKRLKKAGFEILELEFFRRMEGKNALDLQAVNRMVDGLIAHVKKHGFFDAIVCDSVLNSVDCNEAETSVMTLLNAFCKQGGMVFFSGRKLAHVKHLMNLTKSKASSRFIEFLDDDGFSGLYRKGRWFYQKFHSPEQVDGLVARHGLAMVRNVHTQSTSSWQAVATKVSELPHEVVDAAVVYEFNLPVSDTKRLNRHEDVLALFAGMRG